MNTNDFHKLLSPAGAEAIAAAAALQPRERDFLRHLQRLRRQFPDALARSALETVMLRLRATKKFGERAHRMFFTREALEQSTASAIARWRSRRYAAFGLVIDAGCSIGGDYLELMRVAPTVGIERDPLRAAMASINARNAGPSRSLGIVRSHLGDPLPVRVSPGTAVFFDPARRRGERRTRSVISCDPPLSAMEPWLAACGAVGVKLSPAVDTESIAYPEVEIEFISVEGELREAVLWAGRLRSARRRATMIRPSGTVTIVEEPGAGSARPARLAQPGGYLFEPDPAVIRAGLVRAVAETIDAAQLDETIAYLTAAAPDRDAPGTWWHIDASLPFQLKSLRALLRERAVGKIDVKRRGSAVTPEALVPRLKLRGGKSATVVLTRVRSRPWVLVCSRWSPAGHAQ